MQLLTHWLSDWLSDWAAQAHDYFGCHKSKTNGVSESLTWELSESLSVPHFPACHSSGLDLTIHNIVFVLSIVHLHYRLPAVGDGHSVSCPVIVSMLCKPVPIEKLELKSRKTISIDWKILALSDCMVTHCRKVILSYSIKAQPLPNSTALRCLLTRHSKLNAQTCVLMC